MGWHDSKKIQNLLKWHILKYQNQGKKWTNRDRKRIMMKFAWVHSKCIFQGWGTQPMGAAKEKCVEGAMGVHCIGVFLQWNGLEMLKWYSLNSCDSVSSMKRRIFISWKEFKSSNQRRNITKHTGEEVQWNDKQLKENLKTLKWSENF